MNDLDFWLGAWADGRVGSRANRPDNILETHWSSLKPAPGKRVLVPLCGRSRDLAWLASNGFVPVGVEISPIACRSFFAELGVEPVRTSCGPFVKWQGSGVTILQGDFFDLDGTYDAAVDRGALVAIPPARRVAYTNHLHARLAPGAPILLVTIEFDPARDAGPPYPLFPDEVRRLFPGSAELARTPYRRRRWERIGGATGVVWDAEGPGRG